ncbi:MAG: hypothetical protein Q8P82_00735, partial [bacterium]|nr:hypothetical protein [bacterium]
IVFRPEEPEAYEVERDPRIVLRRLSLETVVKSSPILEWYIQNVANNSERFNASFSTQNGDPLVYFFEGVGEYPHEQYILFHQDTAYWFTIEASGSRMHEALPLIVKTVRFSE